ncbi:hypothetical protein GCM10009646_32630 [Streptomyces aureus]
MQRPSPDRRVDDGLRDVRRHGRQIRPQGRERCRVAADPAHPLATGLAPGHIDGGPRGVDPHDLDPPIGQEQREHSRPAADVQHPTRSELLRHPHVRVEIAAVRIERVVRRSEPWMLKFLICHAPEGIGRDLNVIDDIVTGVWHRRPAALAAVALLYGGSRLAEALLPDSLAPAGGCLGWESAWARALRPHSPAGPAIPLSRMPRTPPGRVRHRAGLRAARGT